MRVLLGNEGPRCVARINIVALLSPLDSLLASLLLPRLGVHCLDEEPQQQRHIPSEGRLMERDHDCPRLTGLSLEGFSDETTG
jgi:hypothetical protein